MLSSFIGHLGSFRSSPSGCLATGNWIIVYRRILHYFARLPPLLHHYYLSASTAVFYSGLHTTLLIPPGCLLFPFASSVCGTAFTSPPFPFSLPTISSFHSSILFFFSGHPVIPRLRHSHLFVPATNPWELACRGLIQAGTAPGTLHPKVWIRLPFFVSLFPHYS